MIDPILKHPLDLIGEINSIDDFWIPICASIGPSDSEGAEFFYFYLTSPKKLMKILDKGEVQLGRGLLIINEFDLNAVEVKINELLQRCKRPTWDEVTAAINRFAEWEYDEIIYEENT